MTSFASRVFIWKTLYLGTSIYLSIYLSISLRGFHISTIWSSTDNKSPQLSKTDLHIFARCLNFWNEAWWFLSSRVFGLLPSSLLLFHLRFVRYVLIAGEYRNIEHLYPVMANRIRTGDPRGFNKGHGQDILNSSSDFLFPLQHFQCSLGLFQVIYLWLGSLWSSYFITFFSSRARSKYLSFFFFVLFFAFLYFYFLICWNGIFMLTSSFHFV